MLFKKGNFSLENEPMILRAKRLRQDRLKAFVKVDKERIERYIDEIAAETTDLESILVRPDEEILQDRHILKSLSRTRAMSRIST